MSHLGNISYYLGENNHVSEKELSDALSKVKSLDGNQATLDRTLKHLRANGVDLQKYPVSLGPQLQFDNDSEQFVDDAGVDRWLTREYRSGFELPSKAIV